MRPARSYAGTGELRKAAAEARPAGSPTLQDKERWGPVRIVPSGWQGAAISVRNTATKEPISKQREEHGPTRQPGFWISERPPPHPRVRLW